MGNVREEGINMYLTDNYTPKMNQIISVTDNFRRATVSVSLSTNVMANSINNSVGSASSRVNSLNSSLRKVQATASRVSSSITKLSSSINAVSGAMGSLNGSIMRLAVTIAMIINYFSKLIQKKNEFNSNPIIILIFKVKNNEIEQTNSKINFLKKYASTIRLRIENSGVKKGIDKAIKHLKKLKGGKLWNIIIGAKDKVSSVIGAILPKLMLFKSSLWRGVIAAKDMASGIISKVFPKLRLFAGKVWTGAIAVKDMASSILGSIKGKISDLTNGATIGVAVKKGIDLVGQEQNQKVILESVMKRNTGKTSKKDVDTYYDSLLGIAKDTPFDPKDVVSMGTKAKMISNIIDGKKAEDITKAMVNVRALNMDTSSEQDVSAAFLSAAKGNMESLNTLVGENYKNFDEALKGISKKQEGLAKKMSQTIPGLISSAQTNIDTALKNMIKPFEPILRAGLNKINDFILAASNKLGNFSGKVANVMNGNKNIGPTSFENESARMIGNAPRAILSAGQMFTENIDFSSILNSLFPVVTTVNNLLDSINNKSPIAQGLMSIFGTIVTTAFQLIGPVVEAVSPIITRIFTFLGEHAPQINYFIETLGNVWKTVWETLGPILDEVWKFLEPLLDSFIDALENLCDLINNICDLWKKMVKFIKENPVTANIGDFVEKRRENYEKNGMDSGLAHDSGTNPTLTKWANKFNNLFNKKKKNNAFGLNYVPYNDYQTRLHEGEMVLTKQEANQYRSGQNGGNISIAKLADTIVIREEADIEKVTSKLVASIQMAQLGGVL
ncbi:hypothetical protein GSQ54_00755 [Clostridioides difficile]|uniref:hypothetical protein n=1 Tax=unclassified Clostridioides TaxID=2635829 RepID=UPI0016BB01D1|nr:hypothetical protein [Clostridioides difficile]